jgi:carnosine N-methyltransferase
MDLCYSAVEPKISSIAHLTCMGFSHAEWSAEAADERELSFGAILSELKKQLPVNSNRSYTQRVLVPGCGTGRLVVDISSAGYSCEGNEFSA